MAWRDLGIHLVQETQPGRLIVNAQRIRVEKTVEELMAELEETNFRIRKTQ